MASRRSFLAAGVSALGAPLINAGAFRLFASTEVRYSALACELIQTSSVIDMLGLLTLDYKKLASWTLTPTSFRVEDFQRLKDSGTTIFHPAVGFTTGDVYASSLGDLTRWNAFLALHPDKFMRVGTPADLDLAKVSGKIGIILGLQNSSHFRKVEDVDFFYNMGQRVSQLTYYNNRLGGGSTDAASGLSEFGADVVDRMNSLGMAIDVSHCADRTTLDAIEASRKPVLVTHSNCRALNNSVRCKTDDAIKKLAARGGVLGVTMVRPFVQATGPATVEHVLNHIDHVVSIAGVEHVGLGTDVDLTGREFGAPRTSDLDGVQYTQKIFDLAEGLVRRKYSHADIALILGGNFRRVLAEIWAV